MTLRASIRTAPLPDIPETNASKSGRERVIELAREENLTVRQLAQRLGGYAGLAFVGTPQTIADEMEEWLVDEGSDGFNIIFPYLPQGLDDVAETAGARTAAARHLPAANMRARRCASISACRGRPTGSSKTQRQRSARPADISQTVARQTVLSKKEGATAKTWTV